MPPESALPCPVSLARGHVSHTEHEELLVPLCVEGPVDRGPGAVGVDVGVTRLGKVGPIRHHVLGQTHLQNEIQTSSFFYRACCLYKFEFVIQIQVPVFGVVILGHLLCIVKVCKL